MPADDGDGGLRRGWTARRPLHRSTTPGRGRRVAFPIGGAAHTTPSGATGQRPARGTSPGAGATPWWRSAVVYQIWPRSFADGDGDGIGDLAGIAGRLDHLTALGVDVVWLSPIYPSPQDDAGYDISDYRDIDPVFGSLAAFDALLAGVHERGMKLVMDLVVNHTSDEHPWFQAARRGRDDPRRDWYWWRPPRAGMRAGEPGAEPNNWRSIFGGPAWQLDPASGEYYLHLFSVKQPDLNWENPAVRAEVHDTMRWWLERGVDGFRMDVVNLISKDPDLPDAPVPAGQRLADPLPHVADGPRVHEFLKEMHTAVFTGREGLLAVGEMPGVSVAAARRYTDPACHELDMVFQFEHVGVDHGPGGRFDIRPLRLLDLKEIVGRWQAGLAERGWNSLYWGNHDQPRAVSRFGDDGVHRVRSAKLLATVLHMQLGTPYVYQGDELGMANFPFDSPGQLRDIQSRAFLREALAAGRPVEAALADLRAGARDNARTPMQWDASAHAGFTTGEPWMPVNPDFAEVNAAAQVDDPESVFAHHRELIRLRHELPVVAHGDFVMVLPEDEQVFAFTRRLGGEELLIVANWSGETAIIPAEVIGSWRGAELLVGNTSRRGGPSSPLALKPWEALVYRRSTA